MTYIIQNEIFEGPMDLLIDLIKKREMDIYDIEIHILVEDFLGYIEEIESLDLELTSDFLVMAAYLLKVKSQMLVPKIVFEDEEIIEEDPRDELVSRILEYEEMKKASLELKKRAEYEVKAIYRKQEDFSQFNQSELLKNLKLEDLVHSFFSIIKRHESREEARLELERIPAQDFTLEEARVKIIELFSHNENIFFSEILIKSNSKNEMITYFLTILELIKTQFLKVEQDEREDDILLKRRGGGFIE